MWKKPEVAQVLEEALLLRLSRSCGLSSVDPLLKSTSFCMDDGGAVYCVLGEDCVLGSSVRSDDNGGNSASGTQFMVSGDQKAAHLNAKQSVLAHQSATASNNATTHVPFTSFNLQAHSLSASLSQSVTAHDLLVQAQNSAANVMTLLCDEVSKSHRRQGTLRNAAEVKERGSPMMMRDDKNMSVDDSDDVNMVTVDYSKNEQAIPRSSTTISAKSQRKSKTLEPSSVYSLPKQVLMCILTLKYE